jgi:hypothetical protein
MLYRSRQISPFPLHAAAGLNCGNRREEARLIFGRRVHADHELLKRVMDIRQFVNVGLLNAVAELRPHRDGR